MISGQTGYIPIAHSGEFVNIFVEGGIRGQKKDSYSVFGSEQTDGIFLTGNNPRIPFKDNFFSSEEKAPLL
jgi:hypothetical protein